MEKIFSKMKLEDYVVPAEEFVLFGGKEFPSKDSKAAKEIIAKAEEFLEKEIPIIPASLFMKFKKEGDRLDYEVIYFDRRWRILNLLVAECIEKSGRYILKLMDLVWAVLEETSWIIPAHYHHMLTCAAEDRPNLPDRFDKDEIYIDLFAAETASLIALVYYFLKDEIRKADGEILLKRIEYEIDKRVLQPYLKYENMPWMGLMNIKANNWSPWINSNVLHVAGIFIKDMEIRRQVVAKSARTMDNFIYWYGDDGGCDEGPSYWDAAGGALYDSLEIMTAFTGGKVNLYHESIKPIMEYITKANICGNYYISCGDSDPEVYHSGRRIYRMGENFNSSDLKAFGVANSENRWQIGHMSYKRIYDILTEVPKEGEIKVSDFMCMGDLQLCGIRETVEADKGFYLWLKGGHNGENHNHNDVGSFGVYLNGKPLLVDLGRGTYTRQYFDRATRYTIFATRTCDHNLPLINGMGQHVGLEFGADSFEADEAEKTAKVSYKNAYENSDSIEKLTREASLKNGIISVTDRISLKENLPVEFRFYCVEKAEIADEGVISLGEEVMLKFNPELKAQVEEVVFDDPAFAKKWKRDSVYRIILSTEAKDLTETFIIKKK